MSGELEVFTPFKNNEVGMYVCGPTVYDESHIGHARTYVSFDIVLRYLRFKGYKVKYIVNITDIEDKIIMRANERGEEPIELAHRYEKEFYEDMKALGVIRADAYPRVSDYIKDIVSMVQTLVEKRYAYEIDGDIYFNITKLDDYGKLAHQSPEALKAGARIEVDERKKNPADFTLWKKSKKNEPGWSSPWGVGRPGWHIECSVMSIKHLGEQFEIHGGGSDLLFPHHENEIAQSEAYIGKKPWVKYWLHGGLLTINGEKMAKSLGNFIPIKKLLQNYHPDVYRLFLLTKQYRKPVDYNKQALKHAENSLKRILGAAKSLRDKIKNSKQKNMTDKDRKFEEGTEKLRKKFIDAMDDDFNTPKALAEYYELIRLSNIAVSEDTCKDTLKVILTNIEGLSEVLGLLQDEKATIQKELPEDARFLIEEREKARKERKWKRADEIREQLAERGIILIDTSEGTEWRVK
jgi:cysteinyl-tRNA synthetase